MRFLRQPQDGQRRQRRALGQAVDDQIFLAAVDLAAAHAHRVDHRHAAGGDVVAVAHAAGRLPADRLAEVGAGLADQLEQALRLRRHRLGRPAEAAVDVDRDLVLGRDRGDRLVDQPPRLGFAGPASRGRRLTRRTARSGTTLFGPPPSIRAGLIDSPSRLAPARAAARGRRRRRWRCARPPDCARHGPSGRARSSEKLPLPGRAPGQRAVGQRGRLVGQRRALAARRLRRSAPPSRASRLPRRC